MAKRHETQNETETKDETVTVEVPTEAVPAVQETVQGNLAVAQKTEEAPKYDPAELSQKTTTSARVRYLHSKGLKTGEIAKILNKRYQHVRNVLVTPVKTPNQ